MNLNILKPGKAVDSAFEKPSFLLALALVLLPVLASVAGRVVYGVAVEANDVIYGIIMAYISFFIPVLVVFVLGMVVDRQKTKGKFIGLFSALSLARLVSLAIVVLSLVTLPLVLSPEAMSLGLQAGKSAGYAMMLSQISQFVESNPNAINWPVFNAFIAVGLILTLWGIYLIYKSVKKLTESKPIAAILITIVAFIIAGALQV